MHSGNAPLLLRYLGENWLIILTFGVLFGIALYFSWQETKRVKAQRARIKGLIASSAGKSPEDVSKLLKAEAERDAEDPLNSWILAVAASRELHGATDASALTDAFWSREKERNGVARFIAKNAILLGLIFTVLGLMAAVSGIKMPDATNGLSPSDMGKMATQLGTTLSGMAAAFVSSFLGLAVHLVLSGIIAATFERSQNEYLEKVDVLFQGYAIPAFAAMARAHDASSLESVAERLQGIEAIFKEVKEQYNSQFDQLSEVSQTIATSITQFGMDTKVFTIACQGFQRTAETLDSTYNAGIDKLSKTQDDLQEVVKQGFDIFVNLEKSNRDMHDNIKATTDNYKEVSEKLSSYQEKMSAAHAANEKAVETVCARLEQVSLSNLDTLAAIKSEVPQAATKIVNLTEAIDASLKNFLLEQSNITSELQTAINVMKGHDENLEGVLDKIYADHQAAMQSMYNGMSETFREEMEAAAKQSASLFSKLVPDLTERSQQRLTQLDERLGTLIDGHRATVKHLDDLQAALEFNGDKLQDDLAKRRNMVEGVLSASVERIATDIKDELHALNTHLRAGLDRTMQHASDETRMYLKDLSEAVVTKYSHALEAQLTASRQEG